MIQTLDFFKSSSGSVEINSKFRRTEKVETLDHISSEINSGQFLKEFMFV